MAYQKPGAIITQVQESVSPALIEPDLYTAVIGEGYYDTRPGDLTITASNDDIYWNPNAGTFTFSPQTLFNATTTNVSGLIDYDSVYVDVISVSGIGNTGKYHLNYSKTGSADTSKEAYKDGSDNIVLKAGADMDDYATMYSGLSFRVDCGFRVLRKDISKTMLFEGGSDIQNAIGPTTVFNPLGTAISLAAANSNRMTYGYGLIGDSLSVHTAAQDSFESVEVYALAPLTKNLSTNIGSWRDHAVAMSDPDAKKERIIIANATIPWSGTEGSTVSIDRNNTSNALYNQSVVLSERRLTLTHPDVVYIREKVHITRMKKSYITATIWDDGGYSLGCLLTDSVLLSDGTKYFKFDEVTDVVWANLKESGFDELTVLMPVPGYYLAAVTAGMVSGRDPEQGFTNISLTGIERLKWSSEHFSTTNLNTAAEGGLYILVQDNPSLPVYCRHQLTTDTTTIETRELSIVKSVDFSAKFLRRNLKNVIGKYNITENYLKRLKLLINGAGLTLIAKGVMKDVKLMSLSQDTTQPDRVKGKVKLLAQYPSNYIEIDLIY